MAEFFSTMLGVAPQIIAIAVAFYAAYIVYLRQQQDKYRERIIVDLQKLDKIILKWSFLEEYDGPDWSPPSSKYFQILQKETWTKSLTDEALKEPLARLEKQFHETLKEEREHRSKFGGNLTAGVALYLRVKFELRDFITIIYQQFPRPPGDFTVIKDSDIPLAVKSFIKYDFPNNRKEFIQWVARFNLFFQDFYHIYYRIKPILTKLIEVHEESNEQTAKFAKELEKMGDRQFAINGIKESIKHSSTAINYYERAFLSIFSMKYKVDEIADKIATYDRYSFRGKWLLFLSFVTMVITGIVIPFLVLFSNIYWLPVEIVELITGTGFIFSTGLAILLLYKGIR